MTLEGRVALDEVLRASWSNDRRTTMSLAEVHVRSVPEWHGASKSTLDYCFGAQPPLTVDTIIDFHGGRQTVVNSPAFTKAMPDLPSSKISWGGIQGTAFMGADRQLTAVATVPHLLVEGGDNEGGLTALKLDAEWDLRGTVADWQGDTKVALTELRFSGPRDQVAMKDLSGAAYQRSKGDSVLLGYVLRVGAGSSAKAGEAENRADSERLALLMRTLNFLSKPTIARRPGLPARDGAEDLKIKCDTLLSSTLSLPASLWSERT
jgi:hypothetical protein